MPKSLTLAVKLDNKLQNDPIIEEFNILCDICISPRHFSSSDELQHHLIEGAMLNIGILASKALSVPCGDYMVWMTDAGHTMLVPVADKQKNYNEVFEHTTDQYDIFTHVLLQNWNKLEKILSEEIYQNTDETNNETNDKNDEDSAISSRIDLATVDRKPMLRAMQDRGHTVTSLARAVGVDPPAISRILRTPKDVQGDPKGRNPSMGLASQICGELHIDPTAAFPDIFGAHSRYEPKNNPGNRGSGIPGSAGGLQRKGEATKKWTQGNTSEEFDNKFNTLCEAIAESKLPFKIYWKSYVFPTLKENNCQNIDELLNEFWWPFQNEKQTPVNTQTDAANKQYAAQLTANRAAGKKPGERPGYEQSAERFETAKKRMDERIVIPVKKAFAASMQKFLQYMQEMQYNKNISDKDAPHAWKLAQQFYNAMMKQAATFQPSWARLKPGESPTYLDKFGKARSTHLSKPTGQFWSGV